MIEINTLNNIINVKSDTIKYFNSICYLYGILDENSKSQLFYFLRCKNLYLAARCIMSCAYDYKKEYELTNLSEVAIDDKCNHTASIAMKALIELDKYDVILKKMFAKQSEYKMNNYISSFKLALNNATIEILLNILLFCLVHLQKVSSNAIPRHARLRDNYFIQSTKRKIRPIKLLVIDIILQLKHICKNIYPNQHNKIINSILTRMHNSTNLILFVDALNIAYCHIPPKSIKLMKNHIQSLNKNNDNKLQGIDLDNFAKKHLGLQYKF